VLRHVLAFDYRPIEEVLISKQFLAFDADPSTIPKSTMVKIDAADASAVCWCIQVEGMGSER
jgi:hypothetical protein